MGFQPPNGFDALPGLAQPGTPNENEKGGAIDETLELFLLLWRKPRLVGDVQVTVQMRHKLSDALLELSEGPGVAEGELARRQDRFPPRPSVPRQRAALPRSPFTSPTARRMIPAMTAAVTAMMI